MAGKEMRKTCRYCGETHAVGETCPKKPKRKYEKEKTDAQRLRSTWAWTKASRNIKRRDGGLCLACLSRGIAQTEGLEVHHIVPVEDAPELLTEEQNLITLCQRCHEAAEHGEIDKEDLRALARLGVGCILQSTPRGMRRGPGGCCKTTRPPHEEEKSVK